MTNLKAFVYIAASLMLLYFISTIKVDSTSQIATIVFDDVQQAPYDPPNLAQQTNEKVAWCKQDKDCTILAEAAYYEARGEDSIGVVAVMYTILNRVNKNGKWSNTIEGVVYQNKQFSYTHDGSLNSGMSNTKQVQRMYILAYDVMNGLIGNPIGGSDHYHAVNVSPYWAKHLNYTYHIGNHIFYKE